MDSILKGFPIGSLLVWRTSSYHELNTYRVGSKTDIEYQPGETRQFILDGHQRVMTLYTALGKGIQETDFTTEDLEIFYAINESIYYDLREEKFELCRTRSRVEEWWVPMSELLDDYEFYELNSKIAGLEDGRELVRALRNLHSAFNDYSIAIVPITTDDLDVATNSFERINTGGTKMSEAHMVSALTYREGFDLNEKLESIRQDLGYWQDIDPKIILTICKAQLDLELFSKQTGELIKKLRRDSSIIDKAEHALMLAIEFLAEHCQIYGSQTLPYSHQLVLLADVLSRHRDPATSLVETLKRWLWVTTFGEYFASVSSARLNAARSRLRRAAKDPSLDPIPKQYTITQVLPRLRFDFRAARSRARVWLMANESPRYVRQSNTYPRLEAPHQLLAAHGKRASPKIFSTGQRSPGTFVQSDPEEGFENRMIAAPDKVRFLRDALVEHGGARRQQGMFADDNHDSLLRSHGINDEAAEHLRAGRRGQFFAARRSYFIQKEREFVERLGLFYVDDEYEDGP